MQLNCKNYYIIVGNTMNWMDYIQMQYVYFNE